MNTLTRRHADKLTDRTAEGFVTTADNPAAVRASDLLIVAVEPGQLDGLLAEIRPALDRDRHTLISVVSGATIADVAAGCDAGAAISGLNEMEHQGFRSALIRGITRSAEKVAGL